MPTATERGFLALVLGSSTALAGCPNALSYSTPRTVAPGQFTHAFAIEGIGAVGVVKSTDNVTGAPKEESVGTFTPLLPSYELRLGVVDGFDAGIHLYNLTSLGLDFKLNPLRGVFDLAINPGAQYFYLSVNEDEGAHIFYLHAPVLVGINLSERLSLLLKPGIVYALVAGTIRSAKGRDALISEGNLLFRGGLGVQIRFSSSFALHPELTIMKNLDSSSTIYNAGIGFTLGDLPTHGDIESQKD